MKKDLTAFRTALPDDVGAIVQLVNCAYRPEAGAGGWTHESDWVAGARVNAQQVLEMLCKPCSVVALGLIGTEIVACVHIEKHGDDAHIGMLAVQPHRQGAGLGKQMLAYAEQSVGAMLGCGKAVMAVLSPRPELTAFYLRRGYRRSGIAIDYPCTAGVGLPKQAGLTLAVLEKRLTIPAGI
jgi:GNAT superfamily N-acetyltransferase